MSKSECFFCSECGDRLGWCACEADISQQYPICDECNKKWYKED